MCSTFNVVVSGGGGGGMLWGVYKLASAKFQRWLCIDLLHQSVDFEFEDVLLPSVMLLSLLAAILFGVGQNQAARLRYPVRQKGQHSIRHLQTLYHV